MGIPNYLRTVVNKLKGDVTEKAALNYLEKNGFTCQRFLVHATPSVAIVTNHQSWKDHLERFEKSQKSITRSRRPRD